MSYHQNGRNLIACLCHAERADAPVWEAKHLEAKHLCRSAVDFKTGQDLHGLNRKHFIPFLICLQKRSAWPDPDYG